MTTHFKDRYQEWNEKVQPSEELLGRLLGEAAGTLETFEASEASEALEISNVSGSFGTEEAKERQKTWNSKKRNGRAQRQQSHAKRWGRGIAVAAAFLIAINVSLPVLAGTFPSIYELMYLVSPAVAQFYQPVQIADYSSTPAARFILFFNR